MATAVLFDVDGSAAVALATAARQVLAEAGPPAVYDGPRDLLSRLGASPPARLPPRVP